MTVPDSITLADEHGPIGGKVNLIDATIAIAVIGIALTAYGGYRLFRTPIPKLIAMSPALVYQRENVYLTVRGENLRPSMRITFDDAHGVSSVIIWNNGQLVTARSYVRGNTTFATFELPELMAGTYDVALWNGQHEVARLRNALTVLPLAPALTVEIDVRGQFVRLSSRQTQQLRAGTQFRSEVPPAATILDVGVPVRSTMQVRVGSTTVTMPIDDHVDVPAILRIKCFTVVNADGSPGCSVAGRTQRADVAPGSSVFFKSPDGLITFHISDVLAPKAAH
jgi:hypothetical protein